MRRCPFCVPALRHAGRPVAKIRQRKMQHPKTGLLLSCSMPSELLPSCNAHNAGADAPPAGPLIGGLQPSLFLPPSGTLSTSNHEKGNPC